MNEIVRVIHWQRVETPCVVMDTAPLVMFRKATWFERFAWWLHVKRCMATVWMNDNFTWRARKEAARVIERVKA